VLLFSAHGTPLKYVREGSRYDVYVRDSCARVAAAVGGAGYVIGYQNHTNRPLEWTQPDIAAAVRAVEAEAVVVVPISFMHEQSETLAELDLELRAYTEGLGKQFHRVPVPHDDPRFAHLLADLVTEALAPVARKAPILTSCGCRRGQGTWCTNGDRTLPPSPYVRAAAG
jgi:ferrochelatase